MQLFDVGTGQKLLQTTPMMQPRIPLFAGDDSRLAATVQDGKLGIWQVGDGRELRLLAGNDLPEGAVYCQPSVSPDGRLLAAARTDGFGLWDLASGCELCRFEGHLASVTSVAMAPGGQWALSGGLDNTVRVLQLPG